MRAIPPTVAWSVTGIVLVTALMVAVLPTLLGQSGQATPETAPESVATGPAAIEAEANLPACPAPGETQVVGESQVVSESPLAGLSMRCLGRGADELRMDLALAGRPAVVNVWAWNCGPCRNELPVVAQFAGENPDLTVVGVHENANGSRGVAFLEDVGVELASWQDDDGRFAAALGLPNVVPQTVVLRSDGTVAAILPRVFDSVEQLDAAVTQALA